MYLNVIFRIYPTQEQANIFNDLIVNFKFRTNVVINEYIEKKYVSFINYKDIENDVPWNSKTEIIKLAKAEYLKNINKNPEKIVFDYNFCKWSCDGFRVLSNEQMEVETYGREVTTVKIYFNDYVHKKLTENEIVSLKVFVRGKKWIASVSYHVTPLKCDSKNIMGVDLGIKTPAVAVTSTNKIMFFGNGRQRRFIHTIYKSKFEKYTKNHVYGSQSRPYKWSNKLIDIDHKISHDIIEFAIKENVGLIKMENLSRLNRKKQDATYLSTWSYHRLMRYISYKSMKVGIEVKLINPKNTSKTCPNCKTLNTPIKRYYSCKCGYKNHRDIVGAINILKSKL